MYRSQHLALKYFTAAMILFGLMIVAGLLASTSYVLDGFLLNKLDFSVTKMLHIDTMIIWLLMGFIGSVYWFVPIEFERETVGIRLAEVLFWIFCAAVAVVAAVFIFVQYGRSTEMSLWFINQGRKYVEAPRWAAIGITLVVVVFIYNVVGTAIKARRITGIMGVLMVDLIPLFGLYLIAFPSMTNMSEDQYWWWWLVHLWVEATWEILIGCIMALALMQLLGASRRVVETWLYIEVGLVLGTGILGLGHHYFWIGTPSYWLGIGGFFSALEPLPLLGMVVHAIYDAGAHRMKTTNRPAFFWVLAEAFGNFIGGGVFGFMMTLPQINLFT
ncbi:MAG TPA: cbb3-type cytochrome c oxidase subunit I, partial [Burkholderiales bacterium]|nr:cbb3-type cytochrome c oxidase subunit I [Burkholderiales bacterium]